MSDQQKDDTLAGIGNYLPGPASASLCAAGDSIPWDGYTPQEQDDLKTLPEYQSGLFLINSASFPASLKSSSAEKIDFAHYSPYLAEFNQFYHARLQSQGLYYDLDLVACQQHWEQARLDYDDPLGSCTVEDFITSKHKWQETMTCHAMLVVPNPHKNWDDPLEAFSTLDKMSGCVEFSLMPKTDNSTSRMSVPGPGKDASEYLHYVVMLIFERIRHHLELAAYSRLEQDLVPGEVNTRIMKFLVVLLFSLRRRIAICKGTRIREDTRAGYPSPGTQASTECSGIERMTYFCFQLYVHYFCRYSKMISATASEIISEQVTIDPDTYASIMDCRTTVPTKQGFLDWMKDGEDLYMSPASA
ncbi:hypothetical protein ED733_006336 [Metarhizium rileyi]|uniref:Uncharacterized protein n=1 Tax=Metarhizium rileyi (strain RCEF 4871) TaxID=1649241 RepID=A0A5C6GA19_METRR|nr:hypothetical protein ED733_006336 [Metarhizium rileyi]